MERRAKHQLSVVDHDRNAVEMTYVYPVVSRRAGGVSIGINLNPNNACNWRCIYCQVPGLTFGKAPAIDLELLEAELRQMFEAIEHGSFMVDRVPQEARALKDVAISGNGEPTSSAEFGDCLNVLQRVLSDPGASRELPIVLITNGSLVHKAPIRSALERLAQMRGQVWFKLDSATADGARRINSCQQTPTERLSNLRLAASLCTTWVQSCMFQFGGSPPSESEQRAYLDALGKLARDRVPLRGVLLYTTARPSHQPEATSVSPLPEDWLQGFARKIREHGFDVRVSG